MATIQAYFDIIHEIRGNQEDITLIEIQIVWQEEVDIKEDSDLIVRVSFKLREDAVLISQKIASSKIIYEDGQYHLDLEESYVAIGTYQREDITEVRADIYYIQAD